MESLLGLPVLTQSKYSTLTYTHFGILWTPVYHGYTRILCSGAMANTMWEQNTKESWLYIWHTSSLLRLMLHCLIRIHLQNPNSSFKILKISRQQQWSIKLSMRPVWVLGPVWLNRLYTHKAALYVIFRHVTSSYNTVPQPDSGLSHQCLPFG